MIPDVVRLKIMLGWQWYNPAVVKINTVRILYSGFLVCVLFDFYFDHLLELWHKNKTVSGLALVSLILFSYSF